jgi:hypothetical protein
MSNFTPLVSKTYEFDGDSIEVSFSRLKRKHMIAAMPGIKRLQDAQEAEDGDAIANAINEILEKVIDNIPEYVQSFKGLADVEGRPIEIKTVVDEMYFVKLCSQLALDMIQSSSAAGGNV